MKELHRALVGVSTQVDPYLIAHKRVAKAMYRTSDVHGISPVFRISSDSEEYLVVVYSLRTSFAPDELANTIETFDVDIKVNKADVKILAFDDYVVRKPQYVIPWVELHQTKKWSVPAAYLWPEYVHPIENRDLRSIAESLRSNEIAEFYSQSKSVLDFLSLET